MSNSPVYLVSKENIIAFLNGDTSLATEGSERLQTIRNVTNASPRTFAILEDTEKMSPRISVGDTILIDPESTTIAGAGQHSLWLWQIGNDFVVAAVRESDEGLTLHFDNKELQGPLQVSPECCVGYVAGFVPWFFDNDEPLTGSNEEEGATGSTNDKYGNVINWKADPDIGIIKISVNGEEVAVWCYEDNPDAVFSDFMEIWHKAQAATKI